MTDQERKTYPNKRLKLTIRTLSPLHIGTGRVLFKNYDFIFDNNGQTYVIDEDRLLAESDNAGLNDQLAKGDNPANLYRTLKGRNPKLKLDDVSQYYLDGEPKTNKIREQIKDIQNRAYIPGSSLKGAIRTALLWRAAHRYGAEVFPMDKLPRDNDAAKASQSFEKDLTTVEGSDRDDFPYYDLFRAMNISDAHVTGTQRPLHLVNIKPVQFKNGQIDNQQTWIDLEAVDSAQMFQTILNYNTFLVESEYRLGWNEGQKELLDSNPVMLARYLNRHSKKRIKAEIDYLRRETRGNSELEDACKDWLIFYAKLDQQPLADNECLIQLGWGGGWDSKTFGSYLQKNEADFVEIVNRFSLKKKGKLKIGERFPKSRRMMVKDDQPRLPLGWVKITIEELS